MLVKPLPVREVVGKDRITLCLQLRETGSSSGSVQGGGGHAIDHHVTYSHPVKMFFEAGASPTVGQLKQAIFDMAASAIDFEYGPEAADVAGPYLIDVQKMGLAKFHVQNLGT